MNGEALGNLLRAAAKRKGVNVYTFIRPLTANPHQWLSQLDMAQKPKDYTIANVMALIAGEPMPERMVKITTSITPFALTHLQKLAHENGVFVGDVIGIILENWAQLGSPETGATPRQ